MRVRQVKHHEPSLLTHTVDQDPRGDQSEEETYELLNIQAKELLIKVEVTANRKDLVMDLGRGATLTVMGEGVYQTLWPQGGPAIQPTATLKTYTGEPI